MAFIFLRVKYRKYPGCRQHQPFRKNTKKFVYEGFFVVFLSPVTVSGEAKKNLFNPGDFLILQPG